MAVPDEAKDRSIVNVSTAPAEKSSSVFRSVTVRDAVVCLSFANLCFFHFWEETLAYRHSDTFYMLRLPSPADDLALPVCVLLLGGALFALAVIARRYLSRRNFRIFRVAGLAMLVLPLNSMRVSNAVNAHLDVSAIVHSRFTFLLLPVLVALVIWVSWKWQQVVVTIALTLLAMAFTFSIMTFGEAVRAATAYSDRIHNLPPAKPLPVRPGTPRVLWVIFDEWDYGLTFERRPSDLSLPAIDRFRSESLFATDARTPAGRTDTSIPAMLTGRLTTSADKVPWDKTPNLFSESRREQYNVAVVGWYLPYCRIFAESLTACKWWPLPDQVNTNGDTFGAKVVNDTLGLIETGGPFGAAGLFRQPAVLRYKTEEYGEFLRLAKADVGDPAINFTYLHVPIPHPPHPYNRKTGKFDVRISRNRDYFDSLALMDRMFGEIRQTMESSGVWDKSVVLISADHPLRDPIGKFDIRVPFLLHLPGDANESVYEPRLHTVITADFLLSVLHGEVASRADAVQWLDRHHDSLEMPIDAHTATPGHRQAVTGK